MKKISKDTIRNSAFAGILFGAVMGIFYYAIGQPHPILTGALCGLLYAFGMIFFTNSGKIDRQTRLENVDEKDIVYSGLANHFIKGEAAGGKLYLLNNRIVFKSHRINLQNHELSIELDAINNIEFFNTLGLVPNGLKIIADNKTEKFVVNGRRQWKSKIENIKSS
ncbi:MAG: hypothetical protein EOO51_03480 [Flavobacterium sp.]|nr:MAG: hypothetical protein EOO51_03480 [Flavobacterium sp.]